MRHTSLVAEDAPARFTIRAKGGVLLTERLLCRAMLDQGVQVLGITDSSSAGNRDLESAMDRLAAIVTIVVEGSPAAVKAGVAAFQLWHPAATVNVEVEDENGVGLADV